MHVNIYYLNTLLTSLTSTTTTTTITHISILVNYYFFVLHIFEKQTNEDIIKQKSHY